jgi:hypothetical protein
MMKGGALEVEVRNTIVPAHWNGDHGITQVTLKNHFGHCVRAG